MRLSKGSDENLKISPEKSLEDELEEIKKESAEDIPGAVDSARKNNGNGKKKEVRTIPAKKSIEDIYQNGVDLPGKYGEKKTSLGTKLFLSFLILAILGIVGYGIFQYREKQKIIKAQEKMSLVSAIREQPPISAKSMPEDKRDQEEISLPAQEISPKKSLAEIKISVLNGGAPAGTAGKVKALLVSAGYAKAEAGNALGSDNSGVYIYFSNGYSREAEDLKLAFKDKYPVAETKEASSGEQKSANLVVIMGK
jgi:hypothetical protein